MIHPPQNLQNGKPKNYSKRRYLQSMRPNSRLERFLVVLRTVNRKSGGIFDTAAAEADERAPM